jgi:hypothetical protein
MSSAPDKKVRQMPKGGRKGGSVFPRIALNEAVGYARKLVSKTHTGAQPQDVIFSGVVGAKGSRGGTRISALKQYGLIRGDTKSHFSAAELAKKINAAPPEELPPLYREAVLKPIIFKKIFDTFQGDTVSKAKLKQRASDLKVHPEETATCVELYVASMKSAGLATVDGDQVTHITLNAVAATPSSYAGTSSEDEVVDEVDGDDSVTGSEGSSGIEGGMAADGSNADEIPGKAEGLRNAAQPRPQAVFNVNVTLDSSLDIEKLQKQLELLKRFGAI